MNKQTTSKDSQFNFLKHWLEGYDNIQAESGTTMKKSNGDSMQSSSQIGGTHYTKLPIQPWDFVIANDLDYFQGSIIKYITRWKDKGWIDDLKKARHFLDKYIEAMEEKHEDMYHRPEKP